MSTSLVEQSYWDSSYRGHELKLIPKNDQVRQWIKRFFNETNASSCFEVGCFPGGYLAVFGELGCELHGIDLTPRVETDLPQWLANQGYKVGRFVKADFLDYDYQGLKYDIVCSFGFIEHFTNWKDVLVKQATLVGDNGYLVVAVPNFRGFVQRLIHLVFDKEDYKKHNIASMNPGLWKRIIQEMGFEIIYYGCFGVFDYWLGNQEKTLLQQKLLEALANHIAPRMKKLPEGNMIYSPYCGLIAKKIKR